MVSFNNKVSRFTQAKKLIAERLLLIAFSYIYDATGRKVRKFVQDDVLTQNKQVDYADGFQYENNIIQFFPTAEGYASRLTTKIEQTGRMIKIPIEELPEDQFSYVYNYTDHLGNIRLSYSLDPDSQQLKIVEQNHYYPFGMRHSNYSGGKMVMVKDEELKRMAPATEEFLTYKYRFQSQEFQDELGMNVYFFKWRTYDPALGRFLQIDPVAESYVHNGVYNFAENRVVESIDLEGKESWYTQDGSLATKAGPYTEQARKQLNLYSPSEVQQMKAKQANNKGPMLSQDKMSPSDRKKHELAVRTQMAEKEAAQKTLDNHENLGSPYTAKTVMEGVAYGAVDMATGAAMSKLFQGAKLLFTATKAEETIVVIGEGMGRVQGAKDALLENGAKNVEVFTPSESAMAEWNNLTSGGVHLSDDVVKGTQLYQENVTWIQNARNSGKTILDIGSDGRANPSTFYQMEKQTIYGN